MATTIGLFLPESANLPSSNMPAPGVDAQNRPYLAFDAVAATDEYCDWTFIAPQNLNGTLSLVVSYYMLSATTGSIVIAAQLEAITDADAIDMDTASNFDTINTSSAITVPTTGQYFDQTTLTLTNVANITAGDYCRLRFSRDGNHASDDASGDMYLLAIELRQSA